MPHLENFLEKNDTNTSIIVLTKKEKSKNLLIYDAINRILNKNNILAPSLYSENYEITLLRYKTLEMKQFLKTN